MKNKKILSLLFVAFLVAACSYGTASAFEGRDNLQIPGSGDGGGSGGAVHKLVWTHYSFNTETGKTGQEIWLVPQYITDFSGKYGWNSYQNQDDYKYASKVKIDGECARAGVGFWALTLSTNTSYKISNSGYHDPNLSNAANGSYRNETQYTYLTSKKLLPAASDSYGTYKSGSTYLVYRNASSGGYAPYHTVSFNNNNGISYGLTNNEQTLYYYDGSTMYSMYTSDMIASSQDDIYESYATFYKKQYGETISKEEAPKKMGGSDGTYAFCSFGSKNVDNTINSKTTLSIDGTDTSATSADWNGTATNPTAYITHSNKIKLTTKYTYSREDDDDSTVVATFNKTEKPAGASVTSDTGTIEIGVPDTDSQYLHKEYTISEANKETTICSSTSHSHQIEISEDGSFTEINTEDSEACVKVKYVPVVAEIDSATTLTIGSQSQTSPLDGTTTMDLGEDIAYGENALTAKWGYKLSSKKRCFEGDFKNGACSKVETGITGEFKVPFNRVGDAANDSGEQTLSVSGAGEYSASVDASSASYTLFPGEQIKKKQGISHKSGVHTDGTAASGATDEGSSVEFTGKAKNIICSLNNKPFGLTNSVNYGRLTVIKNDNRSYVSGNNFDGENAIWSTANTVWLDPKDTVKLTYEACIGEQISRDKSSGKAWSNDNKDNNVLLAVGTTGSLLNNSHYKNIEASAVDLNSAEGRNIVAYEKIGTTINTHVANGYQFTGSNAASSGAAIVGNVGKVINNDFGNLDTNGNGSYLSGCPAGSSCYARVTMKIPYNYILNPTISTSKGIVTIGDETKFEVSVRRDERSNQQVDTSKTYKTEVKTATKAKYVTFRLPSDIKYSDLNAWAESHETPDGDITDNLDGFIRASLSTSIGIIGGGELSSADINADKKAIVTVSADDADTDFNKLCVIAGVYPADSHNSRVETIDSENQDNALTDGAGSGAFTRISVSCKTVGKYPTTSVEGNGIVAGGSVIGANTTYSGRNYGSWTEYSLIANSVQNFASGASAAYTNPQTAINASAAGNPGGIKTEYLDSPQTLGNMSADVGLRDDAEAKLRASQMQSYAEDVKATFFAGTPGGSETIKQFNNKTYVNTNYNGDVEISPSLANDINAKANNGLVIIYSTGDIRISNGVQELNAVLIADGKVDTCSEGDQGGDNGELLDNCYNPLVINGVVFSNESIALDRVYGGGSTDGMNLNADSLIQRAEIFNFDPEIVNWGYNYKFENQAITTTYIEELSTRY